jgi:hypothetical protein
VRPVPQSHQPGGCDCRLSKRQAAIIGRNLRVREHSQSETFERVADALQQQFVLEGASGQGHYTLEPSILTLENMTDHLNDCAHEATMEPRRHHSGRGIALEIL